MIIFMISPLIIRNGGGSVKSTSKKVFGRLGDRVLRGAGRPRQIHNAVKTLLESETYKETPGATSYAHPENVSNQLTQRGCDVDWACVHMLDTLGMSNDLPVRPSRYLCRTQQLLI